MSETLLLQFLFGVCACIVRACVRPSVRICPGHNFYIYGFQNNLAQLLSLKSRSRVKSGNFGPMGFSAPLSVLWAL